jgi:Lrp/AsnC family transcriptional regulator, leucine-responsive regulatory protein
MHNLRMEPTINDDLLLDSFDIGILAALQQDSSQTHLALGETVHLSPSQVGRRIQRLHEAGLIAAQVALLSPSLLGLGVTAISYITLSRHGTGEGEQFEQAVGQLPSVLECFAVTGECDYILKIVAADLQELSDATLKALMRLPGVASVRSNIVLRRIKSSTQLPLSHLQRPSAQKRQVRWVQR